MADACGGLAIAESSACGGPWHGENAAPAGRLASAESGACALRQATAHRNRRLRGPDTGAGGGGWR